MDNELAIERTMTIKEVADTLGVTPEAIRKHIRILYPDVLKHGIKTHLTEAEITEIKKELRQSTKVVSTITDLEKAETIQKAFQYITDEIRTLRDQVHDQEPAVDFYNAVTDSKDAIEMSQVAKVLDMDMGRNKLFYILRQKKILRYNNEPYQAFIDAGYFRIIENKWTTQDGEIKISIKTLVYQKGIEYIRKIVDPTLKKNG